MKKRPLVILTNAEIRNTLLKSGTIVNRFPFLRSAKAKAEQIGGCSSCAARSRKGQELQTEIESVKKHLAGLSVKDRQDLKRLLNADQIRIYYISHENGRAIRKLEQF